MRAADVARGRPHRLHLPAEHDRRATHDARTTGMVRGHGAEQAGFVGLGAMGPRWRGTCSAPACSSRSATAVAAKAQAFAQRARRCPASPAPNWRRLCNVIALCVSADADVLGVAREIAAHARPGTIVIDHSTVSPETAPGARADARGRWRFPRRAGLRRCRRREERQAVGHGRRRCANTLARARPVLDAYAARSATWVGSVPDRARRRSIRCSMRASRKAFGEGLALGEALGLDPAVLLTTLASGAAGWWFLDKRGATSCATNSPAASKPLLHKDLGIGLKSSRARQAPRRPSSRRRSPIWPSSSHRGSGNEDVSTILRLKRARRG